MTDGLCVRHCSSREFQPAAAAAAYFGFRELEEALIHGGGGASASTGGCGVDPGVMTRSDVAAQTKRKPFLFFSSLGTSATCQKGSWARFRFSPRRAQRRTGRDMPRLLAPLLVSIPMQHSVQQLQLHCI